MPVSREDVVHAAVRLLDEQGLAGLTLRALAARLGVSAPTLYWHVRDKRHLLDLVAEQVAQQHGLRRSPHPGEPVWEWLAETARSQRAALLAHRDSALVVAGNRPTEQALPEVERTLAVLVEAGLEPAESVRVLTAIGSFVLGDVLETQTAAQRPAPEHAQRPATEEQPGAAHDYPVTAAALERLGGDDERFAEGLDLLLTGLRTRLEGRVPTAPTPPASSVPGATTGPCATSTLAAGGDAEPGTLCASSTCSPAPRASRPTRTSSGT